MSGPKESIYTLTPEQRRILALQRERDERKAVASGKIQRNFKRLTQIGSMFSKEKQVSIELRDRTGDDGGFMQKIAKLENLIASAAPIMQRTDKSDVVTLEKIATVAGECVEKAEEIVKELSEIAEQNEKKLRVNLDAAIDRGFSATAANMVSDNSAATDDRKGELRHQLLQMKKDNRLPAERIAEIDDALTQMDDIQDAVFFKNFLAVTVSPLMKTCKKFLAEYEECHEEFEKLYTEYRALCELYGYMVQAYPRTLSSVVFLRSEIQRIKETSRKEQEQAYISDCLDEVMEEMGYLVLGQRAVTKKSGKRFQNKLYTYGEGTAVNVTYSSDGKVAMELGGLDDVDRLPKEREASVLCDSMESFCKDFREIEKRLLAKGVILAERISMLPPDMDYAQIINTTDYKMKTEAEKFQVKKQSKTVSKLKVRSETDGKI